MKRTILFLLLLTASAAFAQKIHFTDSSNIWVYRVDQAPDVCPGQVIYSYGRDTFLNGHTYKSLIHNGASDWMSATLCSFWSYNGDVFLYVREDITAKIVYSWRLHDTAERVLFNYNLQVGDTISAMIGYAGGYQGADSVFKVDSIQVGSFFYKIIYLRTIHASFSGSHTFDQTIIEGVGTPNWMSVPIYSYWFEHGEHLRCFSNRGTYPAFDGIWTLGYFGYTDTFKNSLGCAKLSVASAQSVIDEIEITPNPSSSHVSISSSEVIHEIILTNISGAVVLKVTPSNKRADLSIESLPSGLYFADIRFGDGGQQRHRAKIVKE